MCVWNPLVSVSVRLRPEPGGELRMTNYLRVRFVPFWSCLSLRIFKSVNMGGFHEIAPIIIINKLPKGTAGVLGQTPQELRRSLAQKYDWMLKPLRDSRRPQRYRPLTVYKCLMLPKPVECRCTCGHREASKGFSVQ